MANPLLTPTNWTDGTSSPPSFWTGYLYAFLDTLNGRMAYTGAPITENFHVAVAAFSTSCFVDIEIIADGVSLTVSADTVVPPCTTLTIGPRMGYPPCGIAGGDGYLMDVTVQAGAISRASFWTNFAGCAEV